MCLASLLSHWWQCLTAPTSALSAVHVAAAKKYILLGLLQLRGSSGAASARVVGAGLGSGQAELQLPAYASAVVRGATSACPDYLKYAPASCLSVL